MGFLINKNYWLRNLKILHKKTLINLFLFRGDLGFTYFMFQLLKCFLIKIISSLWGCWNNSTLQYYNKKCYPPNFLGKIYHLFTKTNCLLLLTCILLCWTGWFRMNIWLILELNRYFKSIKFLSYLIFEFFYFLKVTSWLL